MRNTQSFFDYQSFVSANSSFDKNVDKYYLDHQIKQSDILKNN
ncbi:MAG: hypothetical protein QM489_07915 [Candidatus Izemoplasma sp.]